MVLVLPADAGAIRSSAVRAIRYALRKFSPTLKSLSETFRYEQILYCRFAIETNRALKTVAYREWSIQVCLRMLLISRSSVLVYVPQNGHKEGRYLLRRYVVPTGT